jgi:hypothetical protein
MCTNMFGLVSQDDGEDELESVCVLVTLKRLQMSPRQCPCEIEDSKNLAVHELLDM